MNLLKLYGRRVAKALLCGSACATLIACGGSYEPTQDPVRVTTSGTTGVVLAAAAGDGATVATGTTVAHGTTIAPRGQDAASVQ